MFLIKRQLIADIEILFNGIAHCIQTSVPLDAVTTLFILSMMDGGVSDNTVCLVEMTFINRKYCFSIHIIIGKRSDKSIPESALYELCQIPFYQISYFLPHFFRKVNAIALFQDIVYAALSGLAVDTDHIRVIFFFPHPADQSEDKVLSMYCISSHLSMPFLLRSHPDVILKMQ